MRKRDAIALVAYLAASYPASTFSEATAGVYVTELGDLNAQTVMNAARRHVRNPANRWPPSIGELRGLATMDPTAPSAEEAWAEIEANYSPYGMTFSHPLVGRAFEATFGPNRFGDEATPARFDQWNRRFFCQTYETLARRVQETLALNAPELPTAEATRALADEVAGRLNLDRQLGSGDESE